MVIPLCRLPSSVTVECGWLRCRAAGSWGGGRGSGFAKRRVYVKGWLSVLRPRNCREKPPCRWRLAITGRNLLAGENNRGLFPREVFETPGGGGENGRGVG